jgi:threonine dehydrogenase-like Zn-dependent dehydrogenase
MHGKVAESCRQSLDNLQEDKVIIEIAKRLNVTLAQAARKWGKIVFLGEGGTCEFQPSRDIIHDQNYLRLMGNKHMEELVERIIRWGIKPEKLITHRFTLNEVSAAYELIASGKCGKVAVVFDEEIK